MASESFLQCWKVAQTVQFITAGQHATVALQFPDSLLAQSTRVARAVQDRCPPGTNVAVLADSAFNPEAVDDVAAQHVQASCIVHYGRSSLTAIPTVPVLHVLPELPLDIPACASSLAQLLHTAAASDDSSQSRHAVVFLDQALVHHSEALSSPLQRSSTVSQQGWQLTMSHPICPRNSQTTAPLAAALADDPSGSQAHSAAGYSWLLPPSSPTASPPADTQQPVCCYVGPADETSTLQALQLSLNTHQWLRVHVDESGGVVSEGTGHTQGHAQLVKRRRFLVEKARQASILGILIGTLSCAGLTDAVSHLRALIRAAGKQSYTVLVGKPNPAKLANFPEVEVWIQLSDPLGTLLDSRDYLAPLLTPQEAVLALTGRMLTVDLPLVLGLEPLLGDAGTREAQLAAARGDEVAGTSEQDGDADLALQPLGNSSLVASGSKHLAQAQRGVEYLQLRTWQGVEAPVAGAEHKAPAAAVEGLRGRAAVYESEPVRTDH